MSQALQGLIGKLAAEENPFERNEIVHEMLQHDSSKVVDVLLAELSRNHPSQAGEGYLCAAIIYGLAERNERRVVAPALALIEGNLESPDDHQLEETVVAAFGKLRATEAETFLRSAMFKRKFLSVTEEIASALAAIGGVRHQDVYLKALRSTKEERVEAGIRGLTDAGNEEAIRPLEQLAKRRGDFAMLVRIAVAAIGNRATGNDSNDLFAAARDAASNWVDRGELIFWAQRQPSAIVSAALAPTLKMPAWEDRRLEAVELLSRHHCAETYDYLQSEWQKPVSHFKKLRFLFYLLRYGNPDDAKHFVAIERIMRSEGYDAERDDFYDLICVGDELTMHLAPLIAHHPESYLRWVLLLRDLANDHCAIGGRPRIVAPAALEKIVGSRYLADYEAWVADYRRKHSLGELLPFT